MKTKNSTRNLIIKASFSLLFAVSLMVHGCKEPIKTTTSDFSGIDTIARSCGTDTIGISKLDPVKHKSFSTEPAKARTVTVTVDVDQFWVTRFGSEAKALEETNKLLEEVKKAAITEANVNLVFNYVRISPYKFTGTASNVKANYKAKFPSINSDLALYLPAGNSGIADMVGGVATLDKKYCVAAITFAYKLYVQGTVYTYPDALTTIFHELVCHGNGVPHPHECVHTIYNPITKTYEKNRILDNYGSKCYGSNYAYCRASDREFPNPKYASAPTYSYLCGAPFTLKLQPEQLTFLDNTLSNANALGFPNPACNLTYSNGVITWRDDYFNTHLGQLSKVTIGNTVFSEWKPIAGDISFTAYTSTPYIDATTKISGIKYEADFSKYDKVTYKINGTGKVMCSFWIGSKSLGAMTLPASGEINIPAGGVTKLQIRPETIGGPTAYDLALIKSFGGVNQFATGTLEPKTQYVFRLSRPDGKGDYRQLIFTTP